MYSAKYGRLLGIAEENYQLLQEFMEIYVHGNPGDYGCANLAEWGAW